MDFLTGILNQGLGYIIPMIVLLGLLVFVHELGHYLAAIYYKVRVETFSLGFGPKLFSYVHKGTVYCISAVPLGGYVKMYGDEPGRDVPDDKKNQSYLHKPVGQRIVIALAGPLMNLFFAAVLFYMVAVIGDKALSPEVGEIAANSQAYQIGFRPYDKIESINGLKIKTWEDVKNKIEMSVSTPIEFSVLRQGEIQKLEVTPENSENDNLFSTAERIGKIQGLNSNLHFPVIGVVPGGAFDRLNFKNGDRIAEINGQTLMWFKDIEPTIFEELFNGSQDVEVKVHRFQDFRKRDSFEELNFTLKPSEFTDQDLGIFVPETVIAEVQKDSPAMKAGLQRLDKIISIDEEPILSFNDIVKSVSSYKKSDSPLKVEVERDGSVQVFEMTPQMSQLEGQYGEKENRFTIGVIPTLFVAPKTYLWKSSSIRESLSRAWTETLHWTNVTLMSFVRILQNRVSSKNISGIISIGQVAQQSWSIGLNAFLKMMAIISINLFIINLLPIPILDGGHLLLFTLEAIKGAPISLRKIEMAQQVGFLIILFLMAFALFNDFSRILGS